MASSLGAAFGVAISAAIFAGISHTEGFAGFADIAMGTDNMNLRFAASMALTFNILMVAIAIIAIMIMLPRRNHAMAK
jgi:DHA2 family multidrug resistance protein-like MFS transporter